MFPFIDKVLKMEMKENGTCHMQPNKFITGRDQSFKCIVKQIGTAIRWTL